METYRKRIKLIPTTEYCQSVEDVAYALSGCMKVEIVRDNILLLEGTEDHLFQTSLDVILPIYGYTHEKLEDPLQKWERFKSNNLVRQIHQIHMERCFGEVRYGGLGNHLFM